MTGQSRSAWVAPAGRRQERALGSLVLTAFLGRELVEGLLVAAEQHLNQGRQGQLAGIPGDRSQLPGRTDLINSAEPRNDLLVVSPHTDDAEIGLGGTLAMLARQGSRVWCLDLTRGELGTNDRGDERWDEAGRASAVLGLTGRVQLALPDGFISAEDRQQAEAVAHVVRCLAPRWVVTAPDAWRHPRPSGGARPGQEGLLPGPLAFPETGPARTALLGRGRRAAPTGGQVAGSHPGGRLRRTGKSRPVLRCHRPLAGQGQGAGMLCQPIRWG
jgi:hypothetical protein